MGPVAQKFIHLWHFDFLSKPEMHFRPKTREIRFENQTCKFLGFYLR